MFDYIIIGGDIAACVLASRLSEDPQTAVALLDAGSLTQGTWRNLLKRGTGDGQGVRTVPQPGLNGRTMALPEVSGLAGSRATGAVHCLYGPPDDFAHWAASGNTGWGYGDVLPYFHKVHVALLAEAVKRSADREDRLWQAWASAGQDAGYSLNEDFNGAGLVGVGRCDVVDFSSVPGGLSACYMQPCLERDNLRVFTGARASRVLTVQQRAVGVEFVHEGHTKQLHAAREVLLCAGAIGSPQLLMLSGIGPHPHLVQRGIATVHHLAGVGENLHDHVDIELPMHSTVPKRSAASIIQALQAIVSPALAPSSPPSELRPRWQTDSLVFMPSEPHLRSPDLQLRIRPLALSGLRPYSRLDGGYMCGLSLMRPLSRGRVTLASKDPLDLPHLNPDYLGERDDMERLRLGLHRLRDLLTQPTLRALQARETPLTQRMRNDFEIEHFLRDHAFSLGHLAGTCRMGNTVGDVVSPRLCVHGIAGLRIVDASVMPRLVSVAPQMATLMLAEKAADLVKQAAK